MVLVDSQLQRHYEDCGWVIVPALEPNTVRDLVRYYEQLTLPDKYGIGFRVSLYSADLSTRREAKETLIETAFPSLQPFLLSRRPYLASFLVKEPGALAIPPHQDWSHCDETKHESMMCWIPLCDTDAQNGGLGFISGSHRYFHYLRAFPYLVANTPVERFAEQLFSYLTFPTMRAGDVAVFNNRVIHGSLGNTGAEPRVAISFGLHDEGEPLLSHYLKPDGAATTLLRYAASPDFYLEYTQPRFLELYEKRELVPDCGYEELPYDVPQIEWNAFERLLKQGPL